jgi:hypothetical protein
MHCGGEKAQGRGESFRCLQIARVKIRALLYILHPVADSQLHFMGS